MRIQPHIKSIVKGALSYAPIFNSWTNTKAGSPVGARYYYSVWLRHLVKVSSVRPNLSYDVVAELGPGDALGIAICALLSGAKRYIGLDRIAFGLRADNLVLLDELIDLFINCTPIPDDQEFPGVYPKLNDYSFPYHLITDDVLKVSLSQERLEYLRNLFNNSDNTDQSSDEILNYVAPWDSNELISSGSVDLLISQAVLEHVDDIQCAYKAMHRWLKPSGVMSHRIDYTCHGITKDWFGHWTISEGLWSLIRGKRAYLINRMPHSAQIYELQKHGFNIISCITTDSEQPAPASEMRVPHKESDLSIKGAYIIAELAKL